MLIAARHGYILQHLMPLLPLKTVAEEEAESPPKLLLGGSLLCRNLYASIRRRGGDFVEIEKLRQAPSGRLDSSEASKFVGR